MGMSKPLLAWVVCRERLVYDNLSPAVRKIIGAERELTERFAALASHYLFEPVLQPVLVKGMIKVAWKAAGKLSGCQI